jgi:hypothetical protein
MDFPDAQAGPGAYDLNLHIICNDSDVYIFSLDVYHKKLDVRRTEYNSP